MPNTELPATSVVQNQWDNLAGTRPTNINKPDDDDVGKIKTEISGKEDFYGHDPMPAAAGIVVSVNVDSRAHRYGADPDGEFTAGVELSGSETYSAVHVTIVPWGDWSDDDLARPGGGTWIPSDVTSSRTALKSGPTIVTGVTVTTVQLNVDWIAAGGGFMYLIGQWLPPLLAVASHGLLKREVVFLLSGLLTRPSNKEDFARIFEAFRRKPAYGFNFGN